MRRVAMAVAACLLWSAGAGAQPTPTPPRNPTATPTTNATPTVAAAPTTTAIEHATVYVPGKAPLKDATVVISSRGTILAVGAGVAVPPGALRIDGRGATVTAGLIEAETSLGLVEVPLEGDTNDTDERGDPMRPALRAIDAYNPRSVLIPIARAGGITTAVVSPDGGVLCGQSAAVDLAGDAVAEARVQAVVAARAALDEETVQEAWGTRGGALVRLREALADARTYAANPQAYEGNRMRPLSLRKPHLEALVPVLRGAIPLVVTVERAADIEQVLALGDEFKVRLVLDGAGEAWMSAPELARRRVAVIVEPMTNLPVRFERLHTRDDNAAILARAGVPVIIATRSALNVRRLGQEGGNAVRAGMDHDAAIRAMTEVPAEVFGLRGYGRLEPGAVANVVVWSGDLLEVQTRVLRVFIRGREQSLETRQSALLRRYRRLPAVRSALAP